MNAKNLTIPGLVFLIMSQFLLSQGREYLDNQPIDLAHWFLLLAACLLLSFNFVFPQGVFNSIAVSLTTLGVIAHIGMCTIDFLLWSYGDDYTTRDALIGHLRNTPSLYLPFMVIGPSLLYAGLATHAWPFIRSHTIASLITLGGSALVGLGQMVWNNRLMVVVGCVVFSAGLIMLVFRDDWPGAQRQK